MFSLIARVRRKPERVRRQIAFLVAASLTVLIVLVWLVSINASVRDPADSSVTRNAQEKSPLGVLSDTVGAFISDTEAAVRAFKSGLPAFQETRN